jgi:NADPH:quinone reductase-like Zn-dependent oxidoreductase
MPTHPAIVTVAPHSRLQVLQVETPIPTLNEALIHVEWTASTPLDLHQADGHLLVTPPQVLGDGVAGTVISVGPDAKRLKPGDKVFGFTWRSQKEKAHQKYACAAENLLAILPEGFTMQEAVTLGNNFVTAYHTLVMDLGFEFPWPKPNDFVPNNQHAPVLIWGGASSVGQYAIQLLKYFGHTQILTTASPRNHELLTNYGATKCFDYNEPDVVEQILEYAVSLPPNSNQDATTSNIPSILDCIGSAAHSISPLTHIAQPHSTIAILLPVILTPSTATTPPTYSMDVSRSSFPWSPNVTAIGVRTHFYLNNSFHAEHLQPTIMPEMLRRGIVKPNRVRIVEGETMLERAERALGLLREGGVSGERLVWRVADD